jgi:hypothetical protein
LSRSCLGRVAALCKRGYGSVDASSNIGARFAIGSLEIVSLLIDDQEDVMKVPLDSSRRQEVEGLIVSEYPPGVEPAPWRQMNCLSPTVSTTDAPAVSAPLPALPLGPVGEACARRQRDSLCPRAHAELGEHVLDVLPHRPLADEQAACDLRCIEPLHEQPQDIDFSGC